MELHELARLVRARWRIGVAAVALATSAALLVSWFAPTQYRASVTLLTEISATEPPSLETRYEKYAGSFGEAIHKDENLQPIIAANQWPWTAAEISRSIQGHPGVEAHTVVIDADRESPAEAAEIANGIAEWFVRYTAEQQAEKSVDHPVRLQLSIAERASISTIQTHYLQNTAVGVLFGLVAGVGVIAIRTRRPQSRSS